MVRKATCTDGITRTFTYNGGTYYIPYGISNEDKKDLFKDFPNAKACVLYTEIVVDRGSRVETHYGIPCLIEYNNGQVGYQNGQFFNDITEAKHDYNLRKRLSAKFGIIGYCDVQLVLK